MKLVIERAKWYRGMVGSRLLDGDGQKCCLGFYGLACGLKEKQLLGRGEPCEVRSDLWPDTCVTYLADAEYVARWFQTSWTTKAIQINDDETSSPKSRERDLIAHFAKVGVDVEFT